MFNAKSKNKNYGWVRIRPSGEATVVLLNRCDVLVKLYLCHRLSLLLT